MKSIHTNYSLTKTPKPPVNILLYDFNTRCYFNEIVIKLSNMTILYIHESRNYNA